MGNLQNLEKTGSSHASADAHSDDDSLGSAALSLNERVSDAPRSGHPEWVSDGDGTSVDVHLGVVNAEHIRAVEGNDGEGLVELPEVDVVDGEPVAGEKLGDGDGGADSHLLGGAAADGETDEGAEGGETATLRRAKRAVLVIVTECIMTIATLT